jgi:hypothetical protein
MKDESFRIIDSNGTKYRVGLESGWVMIEEVELYPSRTELESYEQIETENGLMDVIVKSDYPLSFSPEAAEELVEVIEDGL